MANTKKSSSKTSETKQTKAPAKQSTQKQQSSSSSAKQSLEQLKTEVANELGVNLKNSNLTAKEAGTIGGEMVKRMIQRQSKK